MVFSTAGNHFADRFGEYFNHRFGVFRNLLLIDFELWPIALSAQPLYPQR